ncbi:hypothetical protein [Haloferax volcanii]|uniref:hypothetical protein n=1 Tax=Haloferax volcanii TaxID=2246 RepID=UPI00385D6AD6
MDCLRRAEQDSRAWEEALPSLESSQLTVLSFSSTTAQGLEEPYQYDGQTIYSGEFEFTQKTHPFDSSIERSITGEFSYRTESGLFIIRTQTDNPTPSEIIDRFNSALPDGVRIFPGLQPSNEGLWKFIKSAEERVSVTLLAEGEETDVAELDGPIRADNLDDYLVTRAELIFNRGTSKIDVIYSYDSISILGPDEDDYEYVIQVFENEVVSE